jgi:pyruvate dehydrogenase complex dehydrogenase (E1) component
MDIEKLSLLLKPWLCVDTWHTGHPMDDQRFHRALKAAFDELGVQISSDDFRKAIVSCLKEHRPGDVKAFESDIEEFAQRSEDIASYLIDLKP